MPLDDSLELFEQQPKETSVAYEAFTVYKDLGPNRSIEKAARHIGKSNVLLQTWSIKWSWRVRILAWDRLLAKEARKEDIKAARDMRKRHIAISMGMQRLASLELTRLLEDAEAKSQTSRLTSAEVTRLFEAATKIERLNRDLPGDISEQRGSIVHVEGAKEKIDNLVSGLAARAGKKDVAGESD